MQYLNKQFSTITNVRVEKKILKLQIFQIKKIGRGEYLQEVVIKTRHVEMYVKEKSG